MGNALCRSPLYPSYAMPETGPVVQLWQTSECSYIDTRALTAGKEALRATRAQLTDATAHVSPNYELRTSHYALLTTTPLTTASATL
jgi:hypothetical protein